MKVKIQDEIYADIIIPIGEVEKQNGLYCMDIDCGGLIEIKSDTESVCDLCLIDKCINNSNGFVKCSDIEIIK